MRIQRNQIIAGLWISVHLFAADISALAQSKQGVIHEKIFKDQIETVVFHKKDVNNGLPILKLNSSSLLRLSFDDLSGDYNELRYEIIHCDAQWRPSKNIFPADYIDGLNNDYINNYKFSVGTYLSYTHYWLDFPNEMMRPKISGNYIMNVFSADDESDTVLTRRFYVVDNKVSITGQINQPNDPRYRQTHQEIDFEIGIGRLPLSDPFNEIFVAIRQNGRWDNMKTGLKPQFVQNNTLIYDYEDVNLFGGGSEFRFFDLRSVIYARQNVAKIKLDTLYNAILYPDEDRSFKTYNEWEDINGFRIILAERANNTGYEAEYVRTYFHLKPTYDLAENESIYLFGALTDWKIDEEFKLDYNKRNGLFEVNHLFKQGYYNYSYAVKKKGKEGIDLSYFEGNNFETENDYSIYVYKWSPFLNTHELVGVKTLNSRVGDN